MSLCVKDLLVTQQKLHARGLAVVTDGSYNALCKLKQTAADDDSRIRRCGRFVDKN